ncbi:MAG: thermonuclease family protein [Pseudomonadota bacterium]
MKRRRSNVLRFLKPKHGQRFQRPRRFIRSKGMRLRAPIIWGLIFAALIGPSTTDFINGYVTTTLGCRVIGVIDGDTVVMHCIGEGRSRGRIVGYDTPELFSPQCITESWYAFRAKWYLRWKLWSGETIAAIATGQDRYGRDLVRISIDGIYLQKTMVNSGLARSYAGGRRYSWCD